MKDKAISFLKILIVVIVFSGISFFAGRQMQEKEFLTQAQKSKDESTTIAVVNQDSGITYNNKEVNYALDMVNSLDHDFVLTNRESAKKGLEDGKYGGIITLPGNFSTNVISVNDITPSKVDMYYQTNKKLTNDNKLIVEGRISDFEKKLNNKLSYMYVSSMFKELHQGQDAISVVLSNDNSDLEAINAISDSDLLASIDITELENLDVNLEDLDLTENFNTNKKIIEEIDEEYKNRILAKDDSLSEIKSEVLKLTGSSDSSLQSFRNEIKNMTPEQLKEALTKKHQYKYSNLSDDYNKNIDEVNKYIEDLTKENGEIDTLIKKYNNNVLSSINSKGIKAIDKCESKLEAIDNLAKNNNDNIQTNVINKLKELTLNINSLNKSDIKKQSLNEEYLLYSQMIEELKNTNPSELERIYNNVMSRNNVDYKKILKTPTNQVLENNNFVNADDFKGYMFSSTMPQEEQVSAVNRADNYKNIEPSSVASNNIQNLNEVVSNLENVKNDFHDMQMSVDLIRTDSNYKYLNRLFNKDSNLFTELQLDKEFITPLKEKVKNSNTNKLLETIKTNNKIMADDVKFKVQTQVEKVISEEGSLDINGILKMFDEKYTKRFDDLIIKINEKASTPSSINEDEKTMKEIWNKYDNSNKNITNIINTKLDNDREHLEKVYENSDIDVRKMQDSMQQNIEESQNKISEALESAKSTKEETIYSNSEKLQSLSTVLSNSRVGTVENTEVYNFITNPVSTIQTENLATNIKNTNEDESNKYIKYILAVVLLALGSILARLVLNKQKIIK
ncbi:hypothetical protein [Clostridium uliginosum]|uniref:YhgE/Pip N-terminal domain-containing protein n=1 Tax=Clostridium uliginosum TaxID=119641 RepID=A0A1I1PML1_9CLOT|nr:hypothetical protein [Clostridium uliginosum]SFD11124.1 YhgE/Pip N-terminal domain-containing protein [Clostridium uliginosum]